MKTILEFDSIELAFDDRILLAGIYMRCQVGEVTGLLGRNGSGKSSLMKVVFGSERCSHKSVRMDGHLIEDNISQRIIAYLPQGHLIPSHISIRSAFNLFGIDLQRVKEIFPPITEYLSMKPNALSGGYRRLIETLLILTSTHNFCMLDEPFTGLMPIHIDRIKELIATMKNEKGIIISDHMHRHVTDISDRIYLLGNGRTHEIQRHEQLVELGYLR